MFTLPSDARARCWPRRGDGGAAASAAGGAADRRRRRRLAGGRHGGSEQEAIPAGSERQGAPDDPTAEADEVGARDSQARVRALLGQRDAGDVQAAAVLLRGDDGALGARKATLEGAADGASAEAGTAGGGGAVRGGRGRARGAGAGLGAGARRAARARERAAEVPPDERQARQLAWER